MNGYVPGDIKLFKRKALQWAISFETACYFDSNGFTDPYSAFDVLIAAGVASDLKVNCGSAFEDLDRFIQQNKDWILGFLSYDLKNEIENLSSSNPDNLGFPDLYFFKPLHLIQVKDDKVSIISHNGDELLKEIEATVLTKGPIPFSGTIKSRFTPQHYKETVCVVKKHIQRGDIYEATLCQEFYSEQCEFEPLTAFEMLSRISPTPFATFFKLKDRYIISATPERFLSKRQNKLISQPIKGTIKRSRNLQEDQILKTTLKENVKEQSENVMIVDLVRNDLTKCAVPGTVKVEELFGIYSFEQVHQMISTVVSEVGPDCSNAEILKSAFPMGSMTGAPKISAMKLIEKHEKSKRGIFSGAVGYFAPNGNFDFNVIIRTLLYNAENKYLSFQVGGAITIDSDPHKEYEECLLKAEAIRKTLS
ncbi:MAG TPA: anthranilate synthase component I family protein [Pedobacter sp.]|jgi:para-aminobenzoate synthetase component 1